MKYQEILERIAPCGLNCDKCFAFSKGDIRHHSQELKSALGNFEKYAPRISDMLNEPVLHLFPYFRSQLDYFASVNCKGCRKENCKLFKDCQVRSCTEKQGVDFCYQCEKFPCHATGFDENLELRWKQNNSLMKEIGVEAFYNKRTTNHRYP